MPISKTAGMVPLSATVHHSPMAWVQTGMDLATTMDLLTMDISVHWQMNSEYRIYHRTCSAMTY